MLAVAGTGDPDQPGDTVSRVIGLTPLRGAGAGPPTRRTLEVAGVLPARRGPQASASAAACRLPPCAAGDRRSDHTGVSRYPPVLA